MDLNHQSMGGRDIIVKSHVFSPQKKKKKHFQGGLCQGDELIPKSGIKYAPLLKDGIPYVFTAKPYVGIDPTHKIGEMIGPRTRSSDVQKTRKNANDTREMIEPKKTIETEMMSLQRWVKAYTT